MYIKNILKMYRKATLYIFLDQFEELMRIM